jgi:formylglycine-generating enzyme required for sulfatase activity
MSDYTSSSDILKNWERIGKASKKPLGPREFGILFVLLVLFISSAYINRWWKQESFKKNHPAAYQRQILEKNLASTNFRGWIIHLSGNDQEVEKARKLFSRSGVYGDQIIIAKTGDYSAALSVSLSHYHYDEVRNIDMGDIPSHIKRQESSPKQPVSIGLPESVNSIGMKFRQIPAGTFTMGDGSNAHKVTLTQPFMLGVHEVTQEQYKRIMGSNPSAFKFPQNPVEQVSWDDAVEFCQKLSSLAEEQQAGRSYQLPTEAQWEYCCRAESTSKYSFGDRVSWLGYHAWCVENADRRSHRVGTKEPNDWGLYDMYGNVSEWCSDWYGEYPSSSVKDPLGPQSGHFRVLRGGSWGSGPLGCRSADRGGEIPSVSFPRYGFRVVCVTSRQ